MTDEIENILKVLESEKTPHDEKAKAYRNCIFYILLRSVPRTTHHAPRTTHHAPRITHHTPHHTPHQAPQFSNFGMIFDAL
jgi:hypothetical protein